MSEYFILEQETQRTDLPTIRSVPKEIDVLRFLRGSLQSVATIPVHLEVKTLSGVVFPDAWTYLLCLFSDRLRQILDGLLIDNIQYFAAKVTSQDTKEPCRTKYWLANVIGLLDCIDHEQSDGKYDEDLEQYEWKSFVVDPRRAMGVKVFRPLDERQLIVVEESVKEAIEAAQLVGIRLRNTRDFDGF